MTFSRAKMRVVWRAKWDLGYNEPGTLDVSIRLDVHESDWSNELTNITTSGMSLMHRRYTQ